MRLRKFLLLGFLAVAMPALCQVEPAAEGGNEGPENSLEMLIPPIVSGAQYPSSAGADVRQNFLTAAATVNAAYVDNILPGDSGTPVSDTTTSVSPRLNYLLSSPRNQMTLDYDPVFTFYTPTSQLDSVNQAANGSYLGRLTEHFTLELQGNYIRTSDVFDVNYPFSSGGLGGTTQPSTPAAIAPFEQQTRNISSAAAAYQFSASGMVGGGAVASEVRFPKTTTPTGLYNSDGFDETVFYSRRITRRQYAGVKYEYDWIQAYLPAANIHTQVHVALPFYTVFFSKTFSLSAAAGGTYVDTQQPSAPDVTSWEPAIVLSMGWQGNRGNVAASFLRAVMSGGGFVGAYNSVSGNIVGGWKITKTWTANASFTYGNVEPVATYVGIQYQGGNSIMAQGTVDHSMGEHFAVECGYQRIQESFEGIQIINANPDSDREFVSISYQLRKSIGR